MRTLSRRDFMRSAAALTVAGAMAPHGAARSAQGDSGAIRPWPANPRYWEYGGEPVLLLGGTVQDNLFQIPELEEHLDLLASVGGNYIRNTMSARDEGNVWPFAGEDGQYDLEAWNEAYWTRFADMLRWTHERDIFVQIELWDLWDHFDVWERNPWNPANNSTYSVDDTTLATAYDPPGYSGGETFGEPHGFFLTVPALNNDETVLRHQRRFVDRVLEHAFEYGHVLYCVTNEIHTMYPPEWGWYWAEYVRGRAEEAGREAQVTEMYWEFEFSHSQHVASLDRPDVFTYFEGSQNSAINDGEANWANLAYAYQYLEDAPRPINHTKIYGADGGPAWAGGTQESTEAFWRNIVGGSASSRFHRPNAGIGLSDTAQAHIRAVRMFAEALDIFRCVPDFEHTLLTDRQENEAYLTREPGERYGVYFPDGGAAGLDLSEAPGAFTLRWLDVAEGAWRDGGAVSGGETVTLETPGSGHWAAVLLRDGDAG